MKADHHKFVAFLVAWLGWCVLLALPVGPHPPARGPALAQGSGGRESAACVGPIGVESGQVPLTLSRARVGGAPLIRACVDGRGPFLMGVDTGAARSVVSPHLAKVLGLSAGRAESFASVGCRSRFRQARAGRWSVGGRSVAGGMVLVTPIPGFGSRRPEVLLGADVLSRFGAVEIDVKHRALVLGRPPTDRAGSADSRTFHAAMHVARIRGAVSQTVQVRVGAGRPTRWLVDTGSASSVIDASLARSRGLRLATGKRQPFVGVCSWGRAVEYGSGDWSADGLSLPRGPLDAIPDLLPDGIEGLLGTATLSRFQSVEMDWRDGEISFARG